LRDVDEGHSTHDSRLGGEHLGQPDFLIGAQMEIGGSQSELPAGNAAA
jgi:hypothetical protein